MVLVTGGTGHIGNVLVRELVESGERVRTLVLPGEDIMPLAGLGVEILEGNILDRETLDAACKDVDSVYHLAGMISIKPGQDELLQRVNVEGTRNVVQACLDNNVKRMVFTSSIHAYQYLSKNMVLNEEVPFSPDRALGEYGKSKARATMEVFEGIKKGLDAVIVCPAAVIGPYDYRPSKLGQLFMKFIMGKFRFIPEASYNFVDVRDVARGAVLACKNGVCGESYILCGEELTFGRVFAQVEKLIQKTFRKVSVPIWMCKLGAFFVNLFSSLSKKEPLFTQESVTVLESGQKMTYSKAQKKLGFSPRPLIETIRDTVAWFGGMINGKRKKTV
ncbi:MAG: SDR family oxidoreductase [Spirochaetales bacterium]|nr:SDR family oxidoreductase [Spirochaetales bacterium]